jgi:hypothetical protein
MLITCIFLDNPKGGCSEVNWCRVILRDEETWGSNGLDLYYGMNDVGVDLQGNTYAVN